LQSKCHFTNKPITQPMKAIATVLFGITDTTVFSSWVARAF
jgi:hypothetical protein